MGINCNTVQDNLLNRNVRKELHSCYMIEDNILQQILCGMCHREEPCHARLGSWKVMYGGWTRSSSRLTPQPSPKLLAWVASFPPTVQRWSQVGALVTVERRDVNTLLPQSRIYKHLLLGKMWFHNYSPFLRQIENTHKISLNRQILHPPLRK